MAAANQSMKRRRKKKKVTKTVTTDRKRQADAFFDKWIKDREDKGLSVKKRIKGDEKGGSKVTRTTKTKTTTEVEEADGEEAATAVAGTTGGVSK